MTLVELAAFLAVAFAEGRGVLILLAKQSGMDEWLQLARTDKRLDIRHTDGKTGDRCPPIVKLVLSTYQLPPAVVEKIKSNMAGDAVYFPVPVSMTDLIRLLKATYSPLKKAGGVVTATTATAPATTNGNGGTKEPAGPVEVLKAFGGSLDSVRRAISDVLTATAAAETRASSLELQLTSSQTLARGLTTENTNFKRDFATVHARVGVLEVRCTELAAAAGASETLRRERDEAVARVIALQDERERVLALMQQPSK